MIKNYNFIKATDEYSTLENYIPAPYFRRKFHVDKKIKSAVLRITGLGFYELYFNEQNITKGFLAPYRSNPDHFVYFDEYDISDRIICGENVIAVLLGNGIQNSLGAYIWDFDKAPWRSAPKLCFELTIEYENGVVELINSDSNTKTFPSPILFDDLHYGEYYDARLEIEDWASIKFDDSKWRNVLYAETPKGEQRICEAEPIAIRKELKPITIEKFENGYIYDFGVNNAGICRLKLRNGVVGQKILLQHFEMLKDGEPHFDNIRFNRDGMIDRYQEDIYYSAGKEIEEYAPRFTYHGFRYAYVTGITNEQATPELLTYLVMSSKLERMGEFICDDEITNKLQEATMRSNFSNFYYFPTDCPQREKLGWTADASLSAEQMLLNLNPENSYREWLRNIYKSFNDKGQLPGIIPTSTWGYEWGNGPAWDNVIIYLPYCIYIYRGDKTIFEELSVPLYRYLKYLDTRLDENNLIAIGLGDWCQVNEVVGKIDTPLIVTDSILTADIAKKAAFIYGILGEIEKQKYAKRLENKVTTAIKTHLIDHSTMIVLGNTQTAQAMGLFYGMFEENEYEKAFKHLLKLIKIKDNHIDIGVLGNKVIFRVLADNDYADLAFEMITRTDYPSLGNWIARGATTLWESFFLKDDYPINSMNHHFWGDISAWFYTYLAGIKVNPTRFNSSEVNISPCFVEKLNYVNAYHILPDGKVGVEWRRKETGIDLKISVPKTVKGLIKLPSGYIFENGENTLNLESGVYCAKKV